MVEKIAETLMKEDRILILFHASPDGDAVGSAAALLRALLKMGKTAAVRCSDPVPEKLRFLLEDLESPEFEPDYIVAVDVADIRLLGKLRESYEDRIDLAIDHHAGHTNFAETDFVDVKAASNTEIIFRLLKAMNAEIDSKTADAVYTGLATDTGCFKYRNVTANTHEIAAELMRKGARAGEINHLMFEVQSRGQLQAEVAVLQTMEFHFDGKCALMSVNCDIMEKYGLEEDDVNAYVSRPRMIEGVLAGITLKQRDDKLVKISFRTNPPANSSALAGLMGGGGHAGAAGCSFKGTLSEARETVLRHCGEYLAGLKI